MGTPPASDTHRPLADQAELSLDAQHLRVDKFPWWGPQDLCHVDLSRVLVGKEWKQFEGDLLPSPLTLKGERPEGPACYATPTVAYALELGYEVAPTEAYVRYGNGRYLDGWYNRLRDAYVATMADLGVTRRPLWPISWKRWTATGSAILTSRSWCPR